MRYKFITISFIIGIIVAYSTFSVATDIQYQIILEHESREELFDYTNDGFYTISGKDFTGEAFDALENATDAVSLVNVSVYINEAACVYASKVYLNNNKIFHYRLQQGSWPQDDDRQAVVLGIDHKKEVYQREGKEYIHICNEEYLVTGYVSDGRTELYNDTVILFWQHMTKHLQQEILCNINSMQGEMLRVQSNTKGTNEFMKVFYPMLKEAGLRMDRQPVGAEALGSVATKTNYRKYIYLMYVFTTIILFYIMELWMHQREKELIIRRLIGFEGKQLIAMIAEELISLIYGLTFILELMHFFVDIFVFNKSIGSYYLIRMAVLIAIMTITFSVLMIYPSIYISKLDLMQQLGKVDREV